MLLACLVAGCATPQRLEAPPPVDEDALRACLGVKVPPEIVRDKIGGVVVFELYVRPSGKIYYVNVASGSGNPAIDEYMLGRLRSATCSPFGPVDSDEPYSIELELEIQVGG
jgi:outer membrane biosynthesis protein TonB